MNSFTKHYSKKETLAKPIKEDIDLNPELLKEFIYQTHYIEDEEVSQEIVDAWVNFATGDTNDMPQERHNGVEKHLHMLIYGSTPKTYEDVQDMYQQLLGEKEGILRGAGQDVEALGSNAVYVKGNNVRTELNKWLDNYEGQMNTIKSHAIFEVVHPGIDGNGRIGRLILLIAGYPMKDLNKLISNKPKYIDELKKHTKEYVNTLEGMSNFTQHYFIEKKYNK